jgi:acyl-CoA synthetase (AMP-forming)/AMP-acid ligase II
LSQLLTDQLRLMAEHVPDELAYVNVGNDTQITFSEWDRRSDLVAAALIEAGVAKGDRVAIFLGPEEVLRWIVAYAAIHKAGAVAVPTNHRMAPRELEFVLGHAGAVAAFGDDATAGVLEKARPHLPDLGCVLTRADWEALGGRRPVQPVQVPVGADDIADLMYTSGTTGRPKGVVVRHSNVSMVPNGMPKWTGEGWLHASPLFTFAGIASVYNPMKLGMTALYQPRFDAGPWMGVVERRRPTSAFLVPAMAQLLIVHPDFERADLSSLRMVMLGSAPLAPETFRRLQQRLPKAWVSNNWGMTEAGSAYCVLPPHEASRRVGSVGRPLPPVVFRVIDEHGKELPPGEVGELLVSNPGKEREYFRDADGTSRTWRDGWLYTGDLGRLDEDGYLYIVGRKKDVIIRGGNNIHSGDIESVLMEYPGVHEAAVAGIPHDVLGEDVAAWLVADPDLDVGQLRAFLAERLADYKIPRQIKLVAELPRNATGKVLKDALVSQKR